MGDLGKLIVAKSLKSCPKSNKSPNLVTLAMNPFSVAGWDTKTLKEKFQCRYGRLRFDLIRLNQTREKSFILYLKFGLKMESSMVPNSVTRLGDFESSWWHILIQKAAEIFSDFLMYIEKHKL